MIYICRPAHGQADSPIFVVRVREEDRVIDAEKRRLAPERCRRVRQYVGVAAARQSVLDRREAVREAAVCPTRRC